MTYSAVAKADQPHSRYISVHYLGQRYILFNRRGNTSGAYSPNVLAGGFRELRLNGVLGSLMAPKSAELLTFVRQGGNHIPELDSSDLLHQVQSVVVGPLLLDLAP